MTPPSPPPSNIGLWSIRSECNCIIKTNSRNLQATIFIFLFPISLSLLFYQVFPIKTLLFNLLYTLTIPVLSLFATGSTIYSVFHGFHGQPVKYSSSIKAAFTSFFPLLSTWLVTQLIISGIALILGLAFFSLFKATQLVGFQVDHSSSYFILLCLAYAITLMFLVIHLQVEWIFAYVIVVVESSWGLEPLKRSQALVKGTKVVAFKILLLWVFFCWIGAWSSMLLGLVDSAGDKWKPWPSSFIKIFTIPAASYYPFYMFYYLVMNTVFYMNSKALHGKFAGEYVSLASDHHDDDDGTVPIVVSNV
ncbi:hypothetical protein F3Y22_tig00109958pilonHSYRG00032 [Hibiscus syriacus]|uniref:Uncharacterized protein n=1 Tax=Hibiscus syriacus TaxID=106335 RepID=A0A6A3BR82_HIBSY|nr:uncharacterized protein LOC120211130 [Hibiscus syriacus]KAE8719420.1 hypothetical protein F3Y22_tig00109958pilonHSYRG00032 [Hibiscus syriacus]